MLKLGLICVAAMLSAGATTIINDDFESYSAPAGSFTGVAAPGTFGPWSVTVGSVDLLNSFPNIPCRSGSHCVDMDGSTNAAGTISQSFAGVAGTTYTLVFWYEGNQRGGAADTMTVTLGNQTLTLSNILSGQAFTQGTLVYTPVANGNITLQFAHAGGDNIGIILDDVSVDSSLSAVPEPATFGLIGAGILCAGLLRRRATTAKR